MLFHAWCLGQDPEKGPPEDVPTEPPLEPEPPLEQDAPTVEITTDTAPGML